MKLSLLAVRKIAQGPEMNSVNDSLNLLTFIEDEGSVFFQLSKLNGKWSIDLFDLFGTDVVNTDG